MCCTVPPGWPGGRSPARAGGRGGGRAPPRRRPRAGAQRRGAGAAGAPPPPPPRPRGVGFGQKGGGGGAAGPPAPADVVPGEMSIDGAPARFETAPAEIGGAGVRRQGDLLIPVAARECAPAEIELDPLVS